LKEILMKGLRKGEPFYRLYRVLQTVFFLQLATPSAVALWPWLSGRPADGNLFNLGFNLTAFATLLLSWNYGKASNRAAADALQREIDERERTTKGTMRITKMHKSRNGSSFMPFVYLSPFVAFLGQISQKVGDHLRCVLRTARARSP